MNSLSAPLANTGCFGCGSANPIGLQLRFEHHPEGGVTAMFQPKPELQGWDGVMHGGLVSVLLDESMAWAAAAKTVRYVTARLEIRYRQPVSLDRPVQLRGWIERDRGRILEARAQVLSESGGVLAEAEALFVRKD